MQLQDTPEHCRSGPVVPADAASCSADAELDAAVPVWPDDVSCSGRCSMTDTELVSIVSRDPIDTHTHTQHIQSKITQYKSTFTSGHT